MPTRTAKKAPSKAQQLEDMKLSFLYCRTERHKWDVVTDRDFLTNSVGAVIEFTRHDRCDRCGSEKFTRISTRDFRPVRSTQTAYSPGYLARGERVLPNEARREQFNRQGIITEKVRSRK